MGRSDVDIQLVSRSLSNRAASEGVVQNTNYNIFKNGSDPAAGVKGLHEISPELRAFDQRWSQILGREVDTKLVVDPGKATSVDGWILKP